MPFNARWQVITARVSNDVWATSKNNPASAMVAPAWAASACPFSDRGTSCHPVKRFC